MRSACAPGESGTRETWRHGHRGMGADLRVGSWCRVRASVGAFRSAPQGREEGSSRFDFTGRRRVEGRPVLTAHARQRPGSAAGAGLPPGRGATGRSANPCRSAATRCSPWQMGASGSPTLPSASGRLRPRARSGALERSRPAVTSKRGEARLKQGASSAVGRRSGALAQEIQADEPSKAARTPTDPHIGALAPNVQARTAEIRLKAQPDAASGPWPLMFKR